MRHFFIAVFLFTFVITLAASGDQHVYGHEGAAVSPDGMPARPIPSVPIPHHEPGRPARSANYSTSVTRMNAEGLPETVQLTGLDAMLEDEVIEDPFQNNWRLVSLDKLMWSYNYAEYPNDLKLQSFGIASDAIQPIPNSTAKMGHYRYYDIAAGDLNGDLVDEQITAWFGDDNKIHVSIGEMPGSPGRVTSTPAALYDNGQIHQFVRGYDDALWHHDGNKWSNDGGGFLLSGPTVASRAPGQFDVFAVALDDDPQPPNYLVLWQNTWKGSSWTGWRALDKGEKGWPEIKRLVPTPEIAAPAVVATGSHLDLFWLWTDNTLRWRHFNGRKWGDWQNLGGMLASQPGAVAHDGQIDVLARGVDGALWTRKYNGDWGAWQRVDRPGMAEGVTITSAPAVVSPVPGELQVSVLCSDGRLWQIAYNDGRWRKWKDDIPKIADQYKLAGAPAVAAHGGQIDIFTKTTEGRLWHTFYNGLPWADWAAFEGLAVQEVYTLEDARTDSQPVNAYHNWMLDVETGYFRGDGREQIALAYQSTQTTIKIELYDIQNGFEPTGPVAGLAAPIYRGIAPAITAADVDGDGTDEIGIAYLLDHGENKVRGGRYVVEVYDIDAEDNSKLTLKKRGPEIVAQGWSWYFRFAGTLKITSGDFVADPDNIANEEIAVVSDWIETPGHWELLDQLYIFDNDHDTEKTECQLHDPDCPVAQHQILTATDRLSDGYIGQTGLALGAGDVTGDGYDEIVLTWPLNFYSKDWPDVNRELQVLDAREIDPVSKKPSERLPKKLYYHGVLAKYPPYDLLFQRASYLDTLVVGDLDRDLKDESLFSDLNTLQYFEAESTTQNNMPPKELTLKNAVPLDPLFPMEGGLHPTVILALGDFTGDGLRVGPPSFRLQNRVDTPVAVINMPPKHRDLIRDAEGNYQLIESPVGECDPAPDSPNCTHAKYADRDYNSSKQTISTTHAYELSVGGEKEVCASGGLDQVAKAKACVRASIEATHGGNFENSTTEIKSVTYKRKVIAAGDDKVVFFGTKYGIWEYPILSGTLADSSDQAFITVAFPLVPMTEYPDTAGGYYGGTCDEAWFTAGHQPNNVWSYDPIGDITFSDYDSKYEPAYDAIEGDWAEGEITELESNVDFDSIKFKHSISAKVEYESSIEGSVTPVSGSVKAHVAGNYENTHLDTDEITNEAETTYSYFLAPQPESAKFTTRVLFYRARDDSLVLNYQAEPGRSASWQLYDKPDPAFILPWYGFPDPENPQAPPCGEDQKLFSPDIVVDPPYAGLGDEVTISATVRNFSNESTGDVQVTFYQGDPANKNVIGKRTILSLSRTAGPVTVKINWNAAGVGEQKIFAVIDPKDTIAEIHDGDDLIDNNVAYGIVHLSSAGIADMGHAEQQPYDDISYTLSDSENTVSRSNSAPDGSQSDAGPAVSLHIPRASLSAVASFEVGGLASSVAGGEELAAPIEDLNGNITFEVLAFQGSKYKMWDEPIDNFEITKAGSNDPPAVITLAYNDEDIEGLIEDNLTLYRFDGINWEPAACGDHEIIRFPKDNYISVPVCKTGVFTLSDKLPPPALKDRIYLPLI